MQNSNNDQNIGKDLYIKDIRRIGRPVYLPEANAAKHAINVMEMLVNQVEMELEGMCSKNKRRGRPTRGQPSYLSLLKMPPSQVKEAFRINKCKYKRRMKIEHQQSAKKRKRDEIAKSTFATVEPKVSAKSTQVNAEDLVMANTDIVFNPAALAQSLEATLLPPIISIGEDQEQINEMRLLLLLVDQVAKWTTQLIELLSHSVLSYKDRSIN
ncbi:hypothetical protein ACOME3_007902 [Neoechinorhynchus agilis]